MSKVILYNAVSVDGFIAGPGGDSEWVDDAEQFESATKECGCVIVGRTTFEQYEGELYPLNGVQHIVMTTRPAPSPKYANVHYATSVEGALTKVADLGFDRALLIGGGKTNEGFAKAGTIDELVLDIHPLLLGKGIRLLGDYDQVLNLKLLKAMPISPAFIQNHYEVVK